ncbi:Uncharacterised protein [Candidatus Tiddalikarchaeum anstoanum]|nr:Uncharacterised protein [Candidatus Tiddalikarchaeum anstoanum]
MKKLIIICLILFMAGCTSQLQNQSQNGNPGASGTSGISANETLSIEESRISHSIGQIPYLSSAYPGPDSTDVPVDSVIVLFFQDDFGYNYHSFVLFEKVSGTRVSLDTTYFDSFVAKDIGLKPVLNGDITALKPDTVYILKIVNDTVIDSYEFTTGGADTTPPTVDGAYFEGNSLVITFSKRVRSSSITSSGIKVEMAGLEITGDFANLRTSAGQNLEDKNIYITYPNITSGTYTLTVNDVRDASGNTILPYTATIVK